MIRRFLRSREAILLGAIVVLILLISTRFEGFVAPSNLANVFNDTSPLIILALGQMAVILTRCIDLSVAANLALTGMVVAMLNTAAPGMPRTLPDSAASSHCGLWSPLALRSARSLRRSASPSRLLVSNSSLPPNWARFIPRYCSKPPLPSSRPSRTNTATRAWLSSVRSPAAKHDPIPTLT